MTCHDFSQKCQVFRQIFLETNGWNPRKSIIGDPVDQSTTRSSLLSDGLGKGIAACKKSIWALDCMQKSNKLHRQPEKTYMDYCRDVFGGWAHLGTIYAFMSEIMHTKLAQICFNKLYASKKSPPLRRQTVAAPKQSRI